MSRYDGLDGLVGHVVESVHPGKETCVIETTKGTFLLGADGDCCSSSWFEHIDDDGVAGGTVTAVEDSGAPDGWADPGQGDHECLQFYFTTIKTTKGRLLLEMRNSSNGYYGGYYSVTYTPKES